jgi:hypothetical protein
MSIWGDFVGNLIFGISVSYLYDLKPKDKFKISWSSVKQQNSGSD